MDKLYFQITDESRAVGLVTATDLGDENLEPDIDDSAVIDAVQTYTDGLVDSIHMQWKTHPFLLGKLKIYFHNGETETFTIQQTWLF